MVEFQMLALPLNIPLRWPMTQAAVADGKLPPLLYFGHMPRSWRYATTDSPRFILEG